MSRRGGGEQPQIWWPQGQCSKLQEASPGSPRNSWSGEGRGEKKEEDIVSTVLDQTEPEKYDLGKVHDLIYIPRMVWPGETLVKTHGFFHYTPLLY